jgi:hypothetical protein
MIAFPKFAPVLGLFFLASAAAAFGSAANIYITQSGSPTGNCTSNVQTPAFFNNAANWGSGAGQIGPGTTVLICGTFTGNAGATEFTFQGSGSSASPVTLKFDAGAVLTSPYWSGTNGAITSSGKTWIAVDGGANGTIQNTANGTNKSFQQNSYGLLFTNCTNCEIRNLIIKDIYNHVSSGNPNSGDTAGNNTACIELNTNSTGSKIHDNTVSACKSGISLSTDANGDNSNTVIYKNKISDMDWGIVQGGGDAGDTANPVTFHDNEITNWSNWAQPANLGLHQDGIIVFNFGNNANYHAYFYNNYIHGDLTDGSPTGFIYCADFTTCTIYNNLLVNESNGHTVFGLMWLGQSGNMGKDMFVYNNTLVNQCSNSCLPYGPGDCIMMNITGHAIVENNICVGPSRQNIYDTYLTSLSALASAITTSNHNDWDALGNAYGSQANGTTASYSSWTALGKDVNSTQADPLLSSSFLLQAGAPAIGLGANLTGLGIATLDVDKAGIARPASGAWDGGVYNLQSATSSLPAPPSGLTATVQ